MMLDSRLFRAQNALKMAYQKHALQDHLIGWNELTHALSEALKEIMGEDEFYEWADTVDPIAEWD